MNTFLRISALHILLFVSTLAFSINNENTIQETSLSIYPNPVNSGQELNVEIELNDQKTAQIYIYDFAGKQIYESKDLKTVFGENRIQENIVIKEKGLYFIKILTEDNETHLKQSKVQKLYVI